MAIRFDADGEYVFHNSIGLPGNTVPFTIAIWMKRANNTGTYQGLVGIFDSGSDVDGAVIIALDSSDSVFRYTNIDDQTGGDGTSGYAVTNGEWNFFGLTLTSALAELYHRLDAGGSLARQTASPSSSYDDNLVRVRIGDDNWNNEWFDGSVCCVRIWSAVLTDPELLAESYSDQAVRTSDLLADWRLENNTDFTDDSGNGLTLSGGSGAVTDADEPVSISTVPAQPLTLAVTIAMERPELSQVHNLQPDMMQVDIDITQPGTYFSLDVFPDDLSVDVSMLAPFVGTEYAIVTPQYLLVDVDISQPSLFQLHVVEPNDLEVSVDISRPGVFSIGTVFGKLLEVAEESRYLSVGVEPRYLFVDEDTDRNIVLDL